KTFNFGAFKALLKPSTMKKLLAIFALVGVLASSAISAQAQSESATQSTTETASDAGSGEGQSFHEVIKEQFIAGDVNFMTPILIILIIGLAICIERIITLNLATTNVNKLLAQIEDALAKGGVNGALEVTRNTRGPVASIFTQEIGRAH